MARRGDTQMHTLSQNFGYCDNSRGLGAAEMAWSIRKGRTPRANKEMALHALEALHGIVVSSNTRMNYMLETSFQKTPMLPQGFIGSDNKAEAALALD